MTSKQLKWYEKKYLIDYKTQFKIIFRMASVALIFMAILCYTSYNWLLHLRPIFDQTMAGPVKPEEAFNMIAYLLLYRLFGIMLIMFIFFIVTGIFLTHRFTGPIWKLQRELVNFFKGEDISRIQFRKRDEFQSLPVLINKLLEGYKGPRNSQ